MKSCSAGIFIFSADEEFQDKDGNAIWRPRENVIYELGAASLEYGQRIVIFKEKGVYFPTDFRDLGYIEYEKGKLDAKAMDLLTELIQLGAVRITAGT
jgi:predicted nucleotide-binding protein